MEGIRAYGAEEFAKSLEGKRFLFSLVMSYTSTCEIPGITVAGANPDMLKFTPPADAEFIRYGRCRCIDAIPMTPDGKPTPALFTRVALNAADIPFVAINAGGIIEPQMPFIQTGLKPGGDISREPAMSKPSLLRAIEYGKATGQMLAPLTDCLVIGESLPGGTTTAQAVMRGLGIDARSSSSMPKNPVSLKEKVAAAALDRLHSSDPQDIISQLADPMIPFVAGMLSSASRTARVMLAGGTQMAAVLAVARSLNLGIRSTAIGTTRYITDDRTANLLDMADVPVLAVDPGVSGSHIGGLRAFSEGFAKEGAGAGGSMISAVLKAGITTSRLRTLAEAEYARIST